MVGNYLVKSFVVKTAEGDKGDLSLLQCKELTISDCVGKYVAEYCFYAYNNTIEKINLNYGESKVVHSKNYHGLTQLKNIKLGEGFTEIGEKAFESINNLEYVTLTEKNSIERIENCAFRSCYNFKGFKNFDISSVKYIRRKSLSCLWWYF